MKRVLAIWLLVVYAFGATDLHQVFKLPLLIIHYHKHQQGDPALTISGFLNIHYLQPQKADKDYREDMQLPFKAPKDYCMSAATVMSDPAVFLSVPLYEKYLNIFFPLKEMMSSLMVIHSIFQPPQ